MDYRARDHVSEKIDHLFRNVLRADGREFTYDDVEHGTAGRVSRSYIWKLRHGRNRNPSLDVIEAMSAFFHVPPSYFFGQQLGDNREAQEHAEIAALLQDPSARAVAEQARGLSAKAMRVVAAVVVNLRDLDGAARRNGDGPDRTRP